MSLRNRPLLGALALVLGASGCVRHSPMPLPQELRAAAAGDVQTRVIVDPDRDEVVIFAGPFHVPAAPAAGEHHHDGHDHASMGRTPMIDFRWPVEGRMRGFRLSVVDTRGHEYPRDVMHHLIGVNYDRRQLVYPVAERLFGVGTETSDIVLPKSLGVPLDRGSHLGFYVMWNNQSPEDLNGLFIRLSMPYSELGDGDPVEVLPFYADVNNHVGDVTSFDLPPGETVRSYEFAVPASGRIVAAGGHLHDYGVDLQLEDAETGKRLFRLKGRRDGDGRIRSVEQKVFGIRHGNMFLRAGHRYRVVGRYFNPTDKTLRNAAMAHISGIFAPDHPEQWPAVDSGDPVFRKDMESLPRPLGAMTSPAH